MNLVFVSRGKQKWVFFSMGIEIDWTSVFGSKLAWFCVGDINWLGFSVRTLTDLFLVRRSKLTLFLWGCRKSLVLRVSMTNWLGFSDGGRNWLDLSVGDRTWIDFTVGMKLVWVLCGCWNDLLLVCWLEISCFWDEHDNWLGFCMGGPNWLDFSARDRTWLDSSVGWNWFGCVGYRKLLHFSVVDRH